MLVCKIGTMRTLPLLALVLSLFASTVASQPRGVVQGSVTLDRTGDPIHGVAVLIVDLGLTVETDGSGDFRFENIPPGRYDILAHSGALSATTQLIEVQAGQVTTVDFILKVSPIRQEITVTARGQEETAFEAVQSVTSLDSYSLAQKMAPTLGEVLDGESGVSKRSFGPGSSRPVIRGFDGDRVLVMQDGIPVGSLASQSGDHGEPIDPANLERVEIVKGPATLLYGSNAIGGVVNAVTGHHELHQRPHQGMTGQLIGAAGLSNGYGGGGARVEFGRGGWLLWAGGGGQRSGDYDTPIGRVENSKSSTTNASAGLGYSAERSYLSFGYTRNDGRYGIPEAGDFHAESPPEGPHPGGLEEEDVEAIDIDFRRNNYRLGAGLQNLKSGFQGFDFSLSHTEWDHSEVERLAGGIEAIGTEFSNQQWVFRGVFEQLQTGPLGGRFGFWGKVRDYDVVGEEALSPPVDQTAFALFALEELSFEKMKLQFGGRLEWTDYQVSGSRLGADGSEQTIPLPDRDFKGFSAGIGARFEIGTNGAFITNFTSSYRAPALEELYNFGPHVGNLAFEIGNSDLSGERSNGVDLSFRHHHQRIHAQASFFYYDIEDFIYLQPTGEVVEGLLEGEYRQANSRFVGAEFRFDAALRESMRFKLGLDVVDAELTDINQALPRIPPLKARIGFDFRHKGLSLGPELILADRQDQLSPGETPTPGYAVVNLTANYTIPAQHFLHQLSFEFYNVADRLYRNHLSFIKDVAPEIGRGIKFSYVMRFF